MKRRDSTTTMEEGSFLLQVPSVMDQASHTNQKHKKCSTVAFTMPEHSPEKISMSNGSRRYSRNFSSSSLHGMDSPKEDNQEFLKRFSLDHTRTLHKVESQRKQSVAQKVITLAERIQQRNSKTWMEVFAFDPDGNGIFYWLICLSPAILYNLWTCIAREGFPDIQIGYEIHWIVADAIADVIYVMDILIQFRTGYLERGLVVLESKKIARHYAFSKYFVMDLLTLIPLDLLQLKFGIHPILRFPRFLKFYRVYQFALQVEARMVYPNVWRIIMLSHCWYLGLHWFAAFYFMLSSAEGYRTDWGYRFQVGNSSDLIDPYSLTQKYLRSLYWAVLTLTTIGDLNAPESNWEHVFTIGTYITGVYVVAAIIGSVSNVIESRNANRQDYERLLDSAKAYMRNNKVPQDMQRHVQMWYEYAWKRGKMQGGTDISALGLLPDKIKTELALHVNLETLKQECRPEFLQDLVLKMKTLVFTPGDLICKKGEVAREMYIIVDGVLEVIGDNDIILRTMESGDFFGEIGILNLEGGVNRRTADVRSVGYSELILLSRDDVLSALKDHPDAEIVIREYGERRLRELGTGSKRSSVPKITPVCPTNSPPLPTDAPAGAPPADSKGPGSLDRPRSTDSSVLKAQWLNSWPSVDLGGQEGEFDLDVIDITRTINGVIRTAVAKRKSDFEKRIRELEEITKQKDEEIERLKLLLLETRKIKPVLDDVKLLLVSGRASGFKKPVREPTCL